MHISCDFTKLLLSLHFKIKQNKLDYTKNNKLSNCRLQYLDLWAEESCRNVPAQTHRYSLDINCNWSFLVPMPTPTMKIDN